MDFYRRLSDSKSHQVSWTLHSILVDFNNPGDRMVSINPLISNSFNLLGTILSAFMSFGITFILMFHSISKFSGKVKLLALFSLSCFLFRSLERQNLQNKNFFLLISTFSGFLA